MVVANSYGGNELLGEDDSTLNQTDFRVTWILMVVSGFFCTLGKININRKNIAKLLTPP